MSEHWDFALSHVNDGFVNIIGDDDALMPGGLSTALEAIAANSVEALTWPPAAYYWPSYWDAALRNTMSLRATRPDVSVESSRRILRDVSRFSTPYARLPSPYWSLVAVDVIRRGTDETGRFFHSMTPDLYSGVAVAATTDRIHRHTQPLSLSGLSRHSNGAGQLLSGHGEHSDTPTATFLHESSTQFHPDLQYSGSVPVLLAEAMLQARDALGDQVPKLDLKKLLAEILMDPDFLFNRSAQGPVIESAREIARRHGLESYFDELLKHFNRRRHLRTARAAFRNITVGGNPMWRCDESVDNAYEASLQARRILDNHAGPLSSPLGNLRGRVAKIAISAHVAQSRSGRRNRIP